MKAPSRESGRGLSFSRGAMVSNLRIVLEGKLERVEQATLRWNAALQELGDGEWDRRRGWVTAGEETEGEAEAVAALEKKASESPEGLALLREYQAARGAFEKVLSERVKAFGGVDGAGLRASVAALAEHLPLQCTRVFMRPALLLHALLLGVGSVALAFLQPWALVLLTGAVGLALLSVRVKARVVVTQRVLVVNDFVAPFQQLDSAALRQVPGGYVLVVMSDGGKAHRWTFGSPLTDVIELLSAEGVHATSCPVAPVFKEPPPVPDSELDWFDRWMRRNWWS
ncbi:MAG: hypothetical protein QM723_17075 [Myxococcaceae bacterium]